MKGSDCTPEQLASASGFLDDRGWPGAIAKASISRADVVRMLAWYGAMRYIAGRDGVGGSLEAPGPFDVVSRAEEWPCSFSHHTHATREEAVECARQRR